MARKYEIPVCTGCGGAFPIGCTCEKANAKTGKVVTAIDLRDVEPLVEAARSLKAGKTLEETVRSHARIYKALKAFEEQPAGVGADEPEVEAGSSRGVSTASFAELSNISADSDGNQQPQGGVGDENVAGNPAREVLAEGGSVQCDGVALAQLLDAVEFYADPDTYFAIGIFGDSPCGEFIEDVEEIDGAVRPGKRARAALALTQQSSGGQEAEPPCPDAEVCKSCPAADEDDVCLLHERRAAEDAQSPGNQSQAVSHARSASSMQKLRKDLSQLTGGTVTACKDSPGGQEGEVEE